MPGFSRYPTRNRMRTIPRTGRVYRYMVLGGGVSDAVAQVNYPILGGGFFPGHLAPAIW